MSGSLLFTGFIMGCVGLPHCWLMCSVPCSLAIKSCHGSSSRHSRRLLSVLFHIGRLCSYALLGYLAARLVSFSQYLSQHTMAWHPLWVMLQVAILLIGLILLIWGHFPRWLQVVFIPAKQFLYALEKRFIAFHVPEPLRAFMMGALWALLPCVQLYTAVILASMGSSAMEGAGIMLSYALPAALTFMLGQKWITTLWSRALTYKKSMPLPRLAPAASVLTTIEAEKDKKNRRIFLAKESVIASNNYLSPMDVWSLRLSGGVLACSAAFMLMHSINNVVRLVC